MEKNMIILIIGIDDSIFEGEYLNEEKKEKERIIDKDVF